MNITLWGIRGSIPTFNPKTVKYGGHTSCIEVTEDGCLLVLDAGSGIQNLNHSPNLACKRIDILLTHLHIDHIQGLGFFQPLFDPEKEVHIWGPATSTQNLRARLGRFFSPPLFPVYFRNLTCRLFIHEIDNETFDIGPFIVQSQFVIHPSPTVGFRIQSMRGVLTYIPDHEPALGNSGLHSDLKWLSGSDLALGADILLHDAQYTVDEYARKQGWGHCSMEDALQFASLTHVKRLLLMHHDPSRTDEQLDELNAQLQAQHAPTINFQMAVEGLKIEL
jgi:phosphoribosyl 1,2-cyclic phosphodiesterase